MIVYFFSFPPLKLWNFPLGVSPLGFEKVGVRQNEAALRTQTIFFFSPPLSHTLAVCLPLECGACVRGTTERHGRSVQARRGAHPVPVCHDGTGESEADAAAQEQAL